MNNPETIAELVTAASRLITSDSPQLDAELLLTAALGKPRSHLYAWPDKVPDEQQRERFKALTAQRQQGQPISYLLGQREFWSLDFIVSPAVLIPRPDTELLVETALELLPKQAAKVLDLGTGSGAIAISLASERPNWIISASDFSEAALAIAASNNRRLVDDRVTLLQGSWFDAAPAGDRYDLIISNPPYIEDNDPHLQQGDVAHEPASALSSGADGLDDIRVITEKAPTHLLDGGWLMLEHGYNQAEAVGDIMKDAALQAVHHRQDLAGINRITLGQWRGAKS